MLKLKVYRNKGKELVRFTTPDTYVDGGNFAELAAEGRFEKVKKASDSSRDKFYLATAIAAMIALDGKYDAQLSYGKLGGEYAAWVEVEFRGETFIIDPVEFRDIVIPESELDKLSAKEGLSRKWSCNFKEITRHPVAMSIADAMSEVETSRNVIPTIAAMRILDQH